MSQTTPATFGYRRELDKRSAEEREAARQERLRRNDALLASREFRDFLSIVACRAGYFCASAPLEPWQQGYRDALRDLVEGVVMNSTTGADWLAAHAKTQHIKRTKKDNQ